MKKTCMLILYLLCALLCLTGCGQNAVDPDDPLLIRDFVIGDSRGEIRTVRENGETQYVIAITLPADMDFAHCAAYIALAPEAILSPDSPCLVADMGGQPILNLTWEDRDLIVEADGRSRAYLFEIGLQ